MTLESILDSLLFNQLKPDDAIKLLITPEHRKTINSYLHRNAISVEPLAEHELSRLSALVNILQIIHESEYASPLSDDDYETLHELLIDSGVPRISGDITINDDTKVGHHYTNLRGTLDKVHYLSKSEKRTNPSRKYLDDWIKRMETKYRQATGKVIDLNEYYVQLTPKFDGCASVAEISVDGRGTWLTRGDTNRNLATDITHLMRRFDEQYQHYREYGIKFEIMVPEESKDEINALVRAKPYASSRQIVNACLTSKEVDFKSKYLRPIPLRVMSPDVTTEDISSELIVMFPSLRCKLGDREAIRKFAHDNVLVRCDGYTYRTDGVVLTLEDSDIRSVLGRDNDINNFEVAYKSVEEVAYTKVKDVIFETSQFGFICPVVLFNPVILKGNELQRASLSNKERFDELDLHYGDLIAVRYDVIPYVTLDEHCVQFNQKNNR